MKYVESGAALATEMKVDAKVLEKCFTDYNVIYDKMSNDDGKGPYKAYPSGQSYDPWGKKFFTNGHMKMEDNFHVSIIEPCIHYCMGGLKIDKDAQVLDSKAVKMDGLFGAGEVNGGIHGENRLGGSSLLDCVAFGRVAGRSASRLSLTRSSGLSKL